MPKKQQNFENQMDDLEKIISELERGDLSLEETVKKFENGMQIANNCSKLLEDAEKRISIILENDGEIKEEDFIAEK